HEMGAILPLWLAVQWMLIRDERPDPLRHGTDSGRRARLPAQGGPRPFAPAQLLVVFGPLAAIWLGYAILRAMALGSLLPEGIAGAEGLPGSRLGLIGPAFALSAQR